MWTFSAEILSDSRALRFEVTHNDAPASFADVLAGLRGDPELRAVLNGRLAAVPFSAFRWETPPVTTATRTQPFEFVVLDNPGLAQRPDRAAFAEHFRDDGADVVAFTNLGGDAVLVVPSPRAADSAYGHLAAFVREAPATQRHALWRRVGAEMQRRVCDRPVWLSTAGGGVSWLHVRLDDRPKYYGFSDYRTRA